MQVTRTVVQETSQKKCRFGAKCRGKDDGTCDFAHPQVVAVKKVPSDVMALFSIDVSTSMRGRKIAAAIHGMQLVANDAMKPKDVVAVNAFNSSCVTVQKFTRNHKVNWDSVGVQIADSCNGNTALFDSICTSIDSFRKLSSKKSDDNPNQIRVFVLLTDGADNCSMQFSFDDAVNRVAKPLIRDFHFIMLGVGLDNETETKFREQLCAPAHAKFIKVQDADPESIRRAFGTVVKKITKLQAKKIVTTTTTTTIVAAAAAPSPVQPQPITITMPSRQGDRLIMHRAMAPNVMATQRGNIVAAPAVAAPSAARQPRVQIGHI
jgi:Mg-chelatase subunit ChlD